MSSASMEEQSNSQSSTPSKKNFLQAHPFYDGLRVCGRPKSQSDWTDDHLLNLKGIVLRRYTTPSQLVHVVKEGLASLQGTVSHRTVGALMVSAWNLYYFPYGTYVFPETPANSTPDDIDYTELRGTNNHDNAGGADDRIHWPADDSVTCAIGAYVAACLLRLVRRSATNFVNAWPYIKSQYSDINKRPFLIEGLNPIEENLDSIRVALYEWPIFSNTLARFLYHFNEIGCAKWYARFAFEQHLSFTGLHSYSMFKRVAEKLNATPHDLSLALDHRMTRRGLEMINTILQNFEGSTDDKQRRQTWKYTRLFDEKMFFDLQTINCSELAFILAMILKETDDDEGVGEITSILHIQKDYSWEFLKDFLNEVASDIIQQFSSNRRKPVKKRYPFYAGSRHLRGPKCQLDWTDDHLLNLKGIILRRYTTPSQLVPVVKEGLASLQGTVSHRIIGALMVSAWNLYYFPERKYVFPEVPTNTTPDDIDYTALGGNNNPGGVDEKIYWPVDDSVTCAIGAYVAACLLRLATKPASDFVDGWKHIKSQYCDINKRPFLIRGLNPTKENLDSIQTALSEWPIFRNTLARFLYHFNELRGPVKGLARFAFEQHLSLAGLHSYHLFRRVATKLKATPDELSQALNHPMTRRGLVIINTILQGFAVSTDDKQRRQTWKYARLFDEEMFVELKTKNCGELTFILAMILEQMDEDQGVGEITSILHIQKGYSWEFLKDFLNQVASDIIQQFSLKRRKPVKKVGNF